MSLIELFGWYGMAAIVGAYALVSFSILDGNSLLYQLLNVTGALGIITVSLKKGVYQSVVLNAVWVLIGAFALFKIFT